MTIYCGFVLRNLVLQRPWLIISNILTPDEAEMDRLFMSSIYDINTQSTIAIKLLTII